YALNEVTGAAVTQVVAVDAGDDDVFELHLGDGTGKVFRFVDVRRQWLAVRDVAERAAPRTDVAEDHEGRGAAAEAFADIGAGGFFADGMQLIVAQDFFDFLKACAVRHFHAYPFRFAQRRLWHDLDR